MAVPRSRTRESPQAPSASETGPRKLTLSCSRCRASKLKCDRQEPCVECVKRNIGHLCTKDKRQPRAKRAKVHHRTGPDSPNRTAASHASRSREVETEETVQILENLVEGAALDHVSAGAGHPASCSIAADSPNPYWSSTVSRRREEQLALLREIVDALPETDLIPPLVEVFVTRCQGPLGNVVHTPAFMHQATVLYECLSHSTTEDKAMALLSGTSMDVLACHLMALVLGLAFHPAPTILGWSSTPLALRVGDLRASDVHFNAWRSLALRCLPGAVSLFCRSIASLQAAVMLLLDGHEDPETLDAILVTAIAGAQKLGLHRLGEAKPTAASGSAMDAGLALAEMPQVRTEVGIRIWWALVMRDWSRGQALGYYSTHPSQFNTRRPLHINDDDLCQLADVSGQIPERPRSEFATLSYTVHALDIAALVRESMDLRGPGRPDPPVSPKVYKHLNRKYERFVTRLPSHFRLGTTMGLTATGPLAAIPVQRWLLHQQLWSLFLRLHRGSLSSPDGRMSCQLLAQNIISMQAQIQSRCTVCSALSAGETQLFNAAAVLVTDLIFSARSDGASGSQLARLMARDKVREAVELLRVRSEVDFSQPLGASHQERTKAAYRSMTALEALMKLEEEMSDRSENEAGDRRASNAEQSLRSSIIDALRSVQETTGAVAQNGDSILESSASFDFDTGFPFPMAIEGLDELDVLPVLSNDACNIWQFLDFDLCAAPVSKQADLPFTGLMPVTPSSGLDPSWSGTGAPDLGGSEQTAGW
ncbi:hypothetical protein BO71DRAFT_398799 [Aspergillus ellipticus CBS 707.79]|uniref:Zn(2)-C6 fungal-type domain-containing protein n=1 Tax=Aspergillus ellipticus CBS 707.79 TaxID=1448320 RepID=A0A319DAX9_9EURO|nr:hypothetical protein BO71DRAFT_398799 [Aspergillus ellipticus CBS 707.79]